MVWVGVLLGAALAGLVQGLSGFAFGLVAMSVWAWVLEPQLAAVLSVFGALVGQVQAALTQRRPFRWPALWPFLAGGLLGIPLGVYALPYVDMRWFKLGLGSLLVAWCSVMLLVAYLPPVRWGGRWADAVAGWLGGILGGLGGFTGPVPTLWCTLRAWPKDEQRQVIQNFNLCMLSVTMVGYLVAGRVTAPMLPYMALVLPAVLLPVWVGARWYVGLSDAQFRKVVLCLLVLSGVAMLVSALQSLLWV